MKKTFLALFAVLLAVSAPAADLSQAIAEAARYESGASTAPLRAIEQAIRDSAGNAEERASVESALLKLLAPTATFEARRFACTQLAIIGTDMSVPALADLLRNNDTVGMACLGLASNPSPKSKQALRAALAEASGERRLQVVLTLGNVRDQNSVKAMAQLARHTDNTLVEAAISALGKIASQAALEELAALRQKGDLTQARAAALASLVSVDQLIQAGNKEAAVSLYTEILQSSQADYVRSAALAGLLRLEKDDGQSRILEVLKGKDPSLKPVAIAAIRRLTTKDASATFAKQMSKLQASDQVLMVETLAARNDEAAVAAISKAVSADESIVRRAAIAALGKIGDAGTVPLLTKALGAQTETEDRQAVQSALIGLKGGDPVDQAVATSLKNEDEKSKPLLIAVLGKRASRVSVPALLEAASHTNATVAKAAFQALGRLASPEDLKELLGRLTNLKASDARSAAEGAVAQALSKTTDAGRRTAAVRDALASAQNQEARCSLLGLLPSCGDAAALSALKSGLTDKETSVREAAARALAEWPDASATDALLEMAQAATQDKDRVIALRGASRLLGATAEAAPEEAAAKFKKVMGLAKNAEEKKLALAGLGRVHDPAALALANSCLDDKAVQAEAAQAAVTIVPYVSGADRDAAKAVLKKITEIDVDKELKQSAKDLRATIKEAAEFITGWQVTGPYTKEGWPGKDLFGVVFPPEQPDAAGVQWQPMPAGLDKKKPWLLDLLKVYTGTDRAAYARTWVHSPTAQSARLELGSDDGIKAWVNGKVVLENNRGGDVTPASEKAEVALQAGWNSVLLKVTQWSAGWGFCARLAKPDGSALEGIRVSPAPPKP